MQLPQRGKMWIKESRSGLNPFGVGGQGIAASPGETRG